MHTLPGQILIGVALLTFAGVVVVASALIALNPQLSPATVHRTWQNRRTAHRAMAAFDEEWHHHDNRPDSSLVASQTRAERPR